MARADQPGAEFESKETIEPGGEKTRERGRDCHCDAYGGK
jgi:hypothetical protein